MRSSARTFESVSPRRRVTAKSVESPTTRRMYESLSPALAVTGDRVRKARRDDSRTGVRTRGDSSPRKPQRRTVSAADREKQERIDRENRILLRKILEQHHGVRRKGSSIPPPPSRRRKSSPASPTKTRRLTSRQINEQRNKHKTDYENLLLLQKIQNVRPSKEIVESFVNMRIR